MSTLARTIPIRRLSRRKEKRNYRGWGDALKDYLQAMDEYDRDPQGLRTMTGDDLSAIAEDRKREG
jgi:hypothetical protein